MISGKILKQLFKGNTISFGMFGPFYVKSDIINGCKYGLAINLGKITPAYLSALNDADLQFLQSTTSPYLYQRLEQQYRNDGLHKIEDANMEQRQGSRNLFDQDIDFESLTLFQGNFEIRPYVVFGKTLEERLEAHPLSDVVKISRNRYISKMGNRGFVEYLRALLNKQVYGFICTIYLPNGSSPPGKTISLTYQGKVDQQQFFVTDIQNILLTETPEQLPIQ